jgi:hypothetical protein
MPLPEYMWWSARCERCPLPIDERMRKYRWFKSLRERYGDSFIPTYFNTSRARRFFGL